MLNIMVTLNPSKAMIYKCEKREKYTRIANQPLNDERLSLKAKGLLALLLTLPPKWKICINHLAKHLLESRDAIRSIFKELEKHGYARMEVSRSNGSSQFAGREWEVFEIPELNPDFRSDRLIAVPIRKDGFSRRRENADVGENRTSGNPPLLKNENTSNEEPSLINKKRVSVSKRKEGQTHAHFFKLNEGLNEKSGPSPQGSSAPLFPEKQPQHPKAILFRDSVYYTEPNGVIRLREDLKARHERYERAHTLMYYKRLLNWSDSGGHRREDWVAQAASFIDGDDAKGKMMMR